jgi:hypothetical protein
MYLAIKVIRKYFGNSSYIFSLSFRRKDLVKDAIVVTRSLSPPYEYVEGFAVSAQPNGGDFRDTVKSFLNRKPASS